MIFRRPQPARTPARRRRALFVLGLLVGLLGMHALGPAPASAVAAPEHGMRIAATAPAHCHGDHHCGKHGGGHPQHADAACASGALDGSAPHPALGPSPLPAAATADDAAGTVEPKGRGGGRAPPSLAELQLLRI